MPAPFATLEALNNPPILEKAVCRGWLVWRLRNGLLSVEFNQSANHRYMITQGIQALSVQDQLGIAAKVRDFDDFTEDNDPYGEHDFGSLTHESHKVFWKIDYYSPDLQHGSEDPADPEQTCRVLTLMLAHEY